MSGTARTTVRNGVIEVRFENSARLNAMDRTIADAIDEAAARLAAESELRVLLIRTSGKYFSSGWDVVSGGPQPDFAGSTMEARRWYRAGGVQGLADRLEIIEKPVVVAHQGICLGGALELSLSCDFRLASTATEYGLPEIDLGVIPGSGGVSRLTRVVGPHWARWLVMTGKRMSADRALACGLAHEVFDAEDFDAQVDAFCDMLADKPPEVMAMSKITIDLAAELGRGDARTVERLANSVLFLGDERVQAYERFVNRKRSKPST